MESVHKTAPELRVAYWIDGEGAERVPLQLADLGGGYKVLFCFQDWCPGCHSSGFPTLKQLVERLADRGFGFAAIQTVFEGAESNTVEKVRENQLKYGLKIPFGHDLPADGQSQPSLMTDYRTGGTPWFVLIDPLGQVVFSDFRLDASRLIAALEAKGVMPA